MLSNYFIKNASDATAASSSTDSENVSLIVESTSSSSQKKPAKKRAETNGFTADNINERKKMLAKAPAGNWRNFDKVSICYTVLIQRWKLVGLEKKCDIKHLIPLGMQQFGTKLYGSSKCYSSYLVLPDIVKETFSQNMTKDNFDKSKIILEVLNTGSKPKTLFNRIYCTYCQSNILPTVLEKYNGFVTGRAPTFVDLVDNWDVWNVKADYVDVVGCFIPWNADIHAGPNDRRFISRPTEHPSTCHPRSVEKHKKTKKEGANTSIVKDLKLTKVVTQKRKANESGQLTLTLRHGKKMAFTDIGSKLQSKVVISASHKNSTEEFAKGYCLSVVQTGVNKCISQEMILDMYEIGFKGMEWWNEYLTRSEAVSIKEEKKVSPLEVALNKNNVTKLEDVLLETYKYHTPGSLYDIVRKSPYWSMMHDGISKFGSNYNGFYIRAVDQQYNPVYVPWGLPKVSGSLDTPELAAEIVEDIARFSRDGKTNAQIQVSDYFPDATTIPPKYMKMGVLRDVDNDNKVIDIVVENYPVVNCGDGVYVNNSAAVLVADTYGLPSPSVRCSVHASDGTLKRLAKSKTMNVPEIVSLYDCLQPIVRNFKFSIKNKEILDSAMSMLGLAPLKLINWCGTRMAHFLIACETVDKIFLALYNAMYSANIKPDERDTLFSPQMTYCLKLMRDLKHTFHDNYLRQVDKDSILVSTVFRIAQDASKKVNSLNLEKSDAFVDSLTVDCNGNLKFKIEDQEITLNHNHRAGRRASQAGVLGDVKIRLSDIKARVLENITQNIQDQCDESTLYYLWSFLDFEMKSDLECRKKKLGDLLKVFCSTKVHEVEEEWNGYHVTLEYPRLINGDAEEIMDEFDKAWQIFNGLWLTYMDDRKKGSDVQLPLLQHFLRNNMINFPGFCKLILVMIASAANTSPLERSYSILEMICAKRRANLTPEHLETLYLLGVLKISPKSPFKYEKEIELLETKK